MSRKSFDLVIESLPKKVISRVRDVNSDYKGRVTTPFPLTDFTLIVVEENDKTFIVLEVKNNG